MRKILILTVLIFVLACKRNVTDAVKTSETAASLVDTENSKWMQLLQRANVSEESRTAIVRLSDNLKPHIAKALDAILTSASVFKNGSAKEKTHLVFVHIAALADPVLPLAVSLFAAQKTPEVRQRIVLAMRTQMKRELPKIEDKFASDLEKKKLPNTLAMFGYGNEGRKNLLAHLGINEQSNSAKEFLASLPLVEEGATALVSEPTGNCSPFDGNSVVIHCSEQVVGLKWVEFGFFSFVIGVLVASVGLPVPALIPLVTGVSTFIYGAYLAWGSAI